MPVKAPWSANATYWDADSKRVDISDDTAGGVTLQIFRALPVKAQATLLENLQSEYNQSLGREAAKNG